MDDGIFPLGPHRSNDIHELHGVGVNLHHVKTYFQIFRVKLLIFLALEIDLSFPPLDYYTPFC
jgi:hypothetical protein